MFFLSYPGAASAVVKCLPQLSGKLTANAIRVPTPNVSLAVLILQVEPSDVELTKESVNTYLSKLSINSVYQHQIDFINSTEVASSDFVGSRSTGIIDGQATIVKGNQINLYCWCR